MKTCKYHPENKHYANGLCRTCWDREKKWKSRGINIDTEGYFKLLAEQNGTCKFCPRKAKPHRLLDVDHDHITGEIRGLLCSEHNRALGVIEKNIELLGDFLDYIKFAP